MENILKQLNEILDKLDEPFPYSNTDTFELATSMIHGQKKASCP